MEEDHRKLAGARHRKGWSQEKVAEVVGVTRSTLSQWERGVQKPQEFYVHRLCTFYEMTRTELGLEESVRRKPSKILPASELSKASSLKLEREKPMSADLSYATPSQETRNDLNLSIANNGEIVQSPGAPFVFSAPHAKSGLFLPASMPIDLIPTAASSKDCAIWFGMKQAQIVTNIVQWRKHALFCGELQEQLDQEIKMFDQVRYLFDDGEKYSLSRRQVLMSIAMLPVALLKTTQQGSWYRFDIEEFLPRCTASITAVWHLLKGREFIAVEEVLQRLTSPHGRTY